MKAKINSNLYKLIGDNIKINRKKRNLTIKDLAAKLNRSRDFVIDAERGEYRISLDKLYQICDILQINLKSIIPDKAPEDDISISIKEIQNKNNNIQLD